MLYSSLPPRLLLTAAMLASFAIPASAVLVASDDYESVFNSTSGGFGTHTVVAGTPAAFLEAGGRQLAGAGSLGLRSENGSGNPGPFFGAVARTIDQSALLTTNPAVTFSFDIRFDIPNGGTFSGVNLRGGDASTGGFNTGELLSLGLVDGNNNALAVTDASGFSSAAIDFGAGIPGNTLSVVIDFSTATGSYSIEASAPSLGTQTLTGQLVDLGTDYVPRSVGVATGNSNGGGAFVILDNLSISAIPEVSPVMIGSILAALGLVFRGRHQTATLLG